MPIENEIYTFQPVVTHCTVDLPAKAKFQETKQFGGYDACTYCHIPGERVLVKCKTKNKKNQRNNDQDGNQVKKVLQIRYPEGTDSYALRDEQETLRNMLSASTCNNKTVDGIKGRSILNY